MGDFNCVLNREDSIGSPVTMVEMRKFMDCVDTCDMMEMTSSRTFYTWCNKQNGEAKVYSRIDRVLINNAWITRLPHSAVHYRSEGLYDHCPAVIRWQDNVRKNGRMFRYFNMWSSATDFKDRVEAGWRTTKRGTKMFELVGKMNNLKSTLKQLNKEKFTEVEKRADQEMELLYQCQLKLQGDPTNIVLIAEEIERSKAYNGTYTNRGTEDKLDSTSHRTRSEGSSVGDSWNTVGQDLVGAVLEFFRSGKLLHIMNNTVITLIPKSNHATKVEEYRPIFCCNIVYKVISKVMCTRLKPVLPTVISNNQSAFVLGRSIVQNILICQDLVAQMTGFEYHTKCKGIKLNHLCFADDILLFCKRTYQSVLLLLRGLQTFTNAFELSTNAGKSNIFLANMEGQHLELCKVTGYKKGTLPFRYLGVPVSARKLSALDCEMTKKEGDLGMLDCLQWNEAAVAKHVWNIAQKTGNLWVKWVNHIYIKSADWWQYKPLVDCSWYWKRICSIKERFKDGYMGNGWLAHNGRYSIQSGYKWRREE
ncbi:uncharacterized protein LOC132032416 [Lycium ferocissimum]|uniref:uncharacterized protein LOC132032416 n=1 Tax=Lycium ferocissimum TaxID=112874 RepID=UPI0028159C50|nr:uncharacterized protein LOC132032416 [Lycium ferocissimum]